MSFSGLSRQVLDRLAALPAHTKVLLALATTVMLLELVLRRFARGSRAYAVWTTFFQGIGKVWTAVILAVVYFLTVSLISFFMRLRGEDPLDRSLRPEPSFWRAHDANPLGVEAAARHQF